MPELFVWLGQMCLLTRIEFSKRRDAWSTTSMSKYLHPFCFGSFGLKRDRWEAIFSNLLFSNQPKERPTRMSSEEYRWRLVEDFISNFNRHRERNFHPSTTICVDESFSRWYGLGGDWINKGLPCYIALDRKPEAGCEIQSACCGDSGIMCRLKIRKTAHAKHCFNATVEPSELELHRKTPSLG